MIYKCSIYWQVIIIMFCFKYSMVMINEIKYYNNFQIHIVL